MREMLLECLFPSRSEYVTARESLMPSYVRLEERRERRGGVLPLEHADTHVVLEAALSHVHEGGGGSRALTLAYIEAERVDLIREFLGPAAAAAIREQLEKRIRGIVREDDVVLTVGARGVLVLLDADPAFARASLAGRLTDVLAAPMTLESQGLPVHVNIAMLDIDRRYRLPAEVLRDINIALDEAQAIDGHVRIVASDELHQRFQLAFDLKRAALEDPPFAPFAIDYEPIAAMSGPRVPLVGLEATIRWNHPVFGTLDEEAVADVGASASTRRGIFAFVLGTAIAQVLHWRADPHVSRRRLALFVGAGEATWYGETFVETMRDAVAASRAASCDLHLKVTANTLMRHFARSEEIAANLAALGVGLTLDRFGTGESMVARLGRLPLQRVKIAESFVGESEALDDALALATLITRAHGFGLEAIACGVRSEAQRSALAGLGCDGYLGPLLAERAPAAYVTPFLARRRPLRNLQTSSDRGV